MSRLKVIETGPSKKPLILLMETLRLIFLFSQVDGKNEEQNLPQQV
jgi:hypothetical protein